MSTIKRTSSNILKPSFRMSWVRSSRVYRFIVGSRWLHSHQLLLKVIADGLYLTLTTAIGLRTLGEEYTDIYQTVAPTSRKPSALRRWGYAITESYGWYIMIHLLWPRARRQLQRKLDAASDEGRNGYREKFLRGTLAVIENTSSVHLALFYFLGTYYTIPKRIFRIRYVISHSSTKMLTVDFHKAVISWRTATWIRTLRPSPFIANSNSNIFFAYLDQSGVQSHNKSR